ncbi:MAG TPA: hypothetical protein VF076_05605 [Acidimicrobiales bacterium]
MTIHVNHDGVQTWTTKDKTAWGHGPWLQEPDKVQWIDPATNLDCLAVRGPMGVWCGYVGLPPGHPLHGKKYDVVEGLVPELEVHGGLTFSDRCTEDLPEGEGVCHIPEPGRPTDVWWLGFDCGHGQDYIPSMPETLRAAIGLLPEPRYRTLDYCRAEVTRLAGQLDDR